MCTCVYMYVYSVYPPCRLLIIIVCDILHDMDSYDCLNKFYNFYVCSSFVRYF